MILVTGANGLLGKNLIQRLVATTEVHAMVRVLPEDPVPGARYHAIDLGSEWSTDQLPEKINTIIHLAQSSHFREFPEQALDVFRVNVESTVRLLDYASSIGVKRFIYASSGGIYGSGRHAFDENASIVPHGQLGFYLGSKFSGEILVQHYSDLMQVTVLRFFFIYGKEQKRSMLLPRLVDNVKDGRSVVLQGERGIRINPIHVTDATNAVVAALELEESSTFNIAGPEVLSLRQISETIGDRLGVKVNYTKEKTEPRDLVGDISAMREKLGSPDIRFVDGINDLLP